MFADAIGPGSGWALGIRSPLSSREIKCDHVGGIRGLIAKHIQHNGTGMLLKRDVLVARGDHGQKHTILRAAVCRHRVLRFNGKPE